MDPITVLGAGGWIGSALAKDLRRQGRAVLPVGLQQSERLVY